MKTENISRQMKKGVLEMCILAIISKEEVYTSDIIERMKEVELIVVEGTLYPMLSRLKSAGYLEYQWRESSAGPPRKYYKMTEKGNDFLRELEKSWSQLVGSVNDIVLKKSKS
ncbi:MAG: PadR family transcriptional regulator [Saprospirales bacterium]|nr:MAG: PadR family transcriptional regulator [Saprospirales bacterium]